VDTRAQVVQVGNLMPQVPETEGLDGLRIAPFEPAAYSVTSPPLVINGLVITGSSVADNTRPDLPSGEVRAYDARTGALIFGPKDKGKLVRQAISRLGKTAGEMFVLRYYEGFDNKEIAAILNTSPLVVGVVLHRARTKLRKEIGHYLEKHDEK